MRPRVVIVGAGPSGVRAAETLVKAGLRPVVIDEAPQAGGQIYRRPPEALKRTPDKLYGFEAKKAQTLHRAFDKLEAKIDYRPQTSVWGANARSLNLISLKGQETLSFDRLILATGAMDRIVPFSGWTLPGVYTLGAAQIALKYQACAIGTKSIFFGTGPLLYLVAYQYLRAGAQVAAVLDTSGFASKLSALPGLMTGGSTFAKGLYYLSYLRSHGVRIELGVQPLAAEASADGGLSGFSWRSARGLERQLDCDALAFGFGLRSETQLADLCGAHFYFDHVQRQWLPEQDGDGRARGLSFLYLAGDGAIVKGADLAELAGQRAAHALLSDIGHRKSRAELKSLNRTLAKNERFRNALDDKAFRFPAQLAAKLADDVMLCRCEGITVGQLRGLAEELGASELNRAKAFSRVGMGRCQGRVCAAAASEVLAASLSLPLEDVGRLRGQAPVKPLPMASFLEERFHDRL